MIVLPLTTVSLMLGGTDKVALGTSATFGLVRAPQSLMIDREFQVSRGVVLIIAENRPQPRRTAIQLGELDQ
jgi:hypothetical protein